MYLDEYNYLNKTYCLLYPESKVSLAEEGKVTVASGAKGSEVELCIDPDSYGLRNNVCYLIPLVVRSRSANVVAKDGIRVNYIISRKCMKAVKNILYFEVNDVNPLNALEYRIEDGSMFFDAVVLFAANIDWDGQRQRVYLHQDPDVKALLDNTEEKGYGWFMWFSSDPMKKLEGGELKIPIEANVDYTVTTSDSWITHNGKTGNEEPFTFRQQERVCDV